MSRLLAAVAGAIDWLASLDVYRFYALLGSVLAVVSLGFCGHFASLGDVQGAVGAGVFAALYAAMAAYNVGASR